ncbi:MAG: ABC transporter permease, partial [Gemmatimonadaceae bacterium]
MIRDGIQRAFRLALRRRDRWESDVEEEIKLHLALRAEQLMQQGATPDSAYAEAVRRFGTLKESRARLIEAARHREQRMNRSEYLDNLRHDLSFALRTLSRQKVWTAVTIITLALGIGATTAVFSVVSTLLLHPLPYPNAGRIVYVFQEPSTGNNTGIRVSIVPAVPVVRAWMKSSRSFESFEGSQLGPRAMKTDGDPSTVMVESIFPTFAAWAGQRPMLGRMFTQHDIDAGAPVVVLSEAFWRSRLAGDSHVLGQRLTLGDSMFAIIGVMPSGFQRGTVSGRPADMWIPLDVRIDNLRMSVIGRLRPGVNKEAAAAELDSIFTRTSGFSSGKSPFTAVVSTPAERVSFRDSLVLLTAAVALVLLVACANVAHLLLGRASTRRREMAIRAALGAGRGRILRQLLTESSILSFAGTLAGLAVCWAGLRGLIALRPQDLDELRGAHLDLTTLGVAIGIAVVTGIAFALVGAAQAGRANTNESLKNGALAVGSSGGRARGLLVVSEMALSATLLVGATLLVRSVINLQRADLGFDPRGLYTLNLPLEKSHIESDAARLQVLTELTSRLRSMPAIRSASVADVAPGSRRFTVGQLQAEGEAEPPAGSLAFIDVNS